MTVVEISECFPGNFRPVQGEFIQRHAEALSGHCNVTVVVPLRFFPPKELFKKNPFKTIKNIYSWLQKNSTDKDFSKGNLKIIYFPYFSLPKPLLEIYDGSFIRFFFYRKLQKVIEKEKPDIIYCNWLRPWAEISVVIADDLNVPFIIDHHEDIPTLKKLFPEKYKHFLKFFERASEVIVHSSVNKSELESEMKNCGLNLKSIEVVHLGQNFSSPGENKNFNSGRIKLICISHLYEERKNIDVLIKAMSAVRCNLDCELSIIGDGILKEKYQELARQLNLNSQIKFCGQKSRQEIEDLLEDSDIFVLPSYPEAFGIVFIEAISKGLPVIACKGSGGGEELNQLGYPIVLTEPNSPDKLAKAISELSLNKEKIKLMSESGKKIAGEFFTWQKNAEATYRLLNKVIKEYKNRKDVRH